MQGKTKIKKKTKKRRKLVIFSPIHLIFSKTHVGDFYTHVFSLKKD